MDEERLADLVGSIQRIGLQDPVGVRVQGDEYVVVFGHRRREACGRAGLTEIPCQILSGEEAEMREACFAENFFSEDLTPLELAVAIAREYEEGTMTVEQMAAGFRRSVDWVKRQVSITHWPNDVLEAIHVHGLSIAAASNLALVDDESYRSFLLRNAVENGATARTTASWLQAFRAAQPAEVQEVLEGGESVRPLVPAAPMSPCLGCGEVKRVDSMSHCPLCPPCIAAIREARLQTSV
jgi:ParB family chromosome partitioning protein